MILELLLIVAPFVTAVPTPNPAKFTPTRTPCISSPKSNCPTKTNTPHIGPRRTAPAIPETYLTATAVASLSVMPAPSASPTPKPGGGCGHKGGSTLALLAVGVGLVVARRRSNGPV